MLRGITRRRTTRDASRCARPNYGKRNAGPSCLPLVGTGIDQNNPSLIARIEELGLNRPQYTSSERREGYSRPS